MLIKFNFLGTTVINIPDSEYWEIRHNPFDEDGKSLCLVFGEEERPIRDLDYFCSGRPDLPADAVDDLYEEIVEVIAGRLSSGSCLFIDIDEIETELLKGKYPLWVARGYIHPDANGHW